MPSYRFKFYDPNSRSEKLGAAVLADDDEAVAFAQRVIRELVHSDEQLYAGWMVKITTKERNVASIPFASHATAGEGDGAFLPIDRTS
jgi:hypothetical protein